MLFDDGLENGELDILVVVYRNVPESDHVFHGGGGSVAEYAVLSQELE